MVKKRHERMLRQNQVQFLQNVQSAFDARGYGREDIARELKLYFADENCKWASITQVSKYLKGRKHFDDRIRNRPKEHVDLPLELAVAFAKLLDTTIDALCGLAPQRPDVTGLADPAYIRRWLRGRRRPSMCHVYEDRIERYFHHQARPIQVSVAPTNEFSQPESRLALLGTFGGDALHVALNTRSAKSVLVGLGKHVNAAVQYIRELPQPPIEANADVQWMPTMGTYDDLDFFSANAYCEDLRDHVGGYFPLTLRSPGYIPIDHDDDELREVLQEYSHRALFGNPFELSEHAGISSHGGVVGRAHGADTAIAGCGVAAPGNPLWDKEDRLHNPFDIREADCPAVGDLNGHYLCVDRNGHPTLLSENPLVPDNRNLPAWDANRRALGARPSTYQAIARHFRRSHSLGGGVTVMANAADRAPAVYAMIGLDLVNHIVMDFDCGKALNDLLIEPRNVAYAVPHRSYW